MRYEHYNCIARKIQFEFAFFPAELTPKTHEPYAWQSCCSYFRMFLPMQWDLYYKHSNGELSAPRALHLMCIGLSSQVESSVVRAYWPTGLILTSATIP